VGQVHCAHRFSGYFLFVFFVIVWLSALEQLIAWKDAFLECDKNVFLCVELHLKP